MGGKKLSYLKEKYSYREFEDLIAELWKKRGFDVSYKTECTDTPDKGIDLVCQKEKRKVGLQVKFNSSDSNTSRKEVSDLVGSCCAHNMGYATFVTTGSFTDDCRFYEQELPNNICEITLNLYDGRNIVDLLSAYNLVWD